MFIFLCHHMINVLYNINPCLALTYIEPVQLSNIYIFTTHHGGNLILRGLQQALILTIGIITIWKVVTDLAVTSLLKVTMPGI